MSGAAFQDRFLRAAPILLIPAFLGQALLSARLASWVHPEPFNPAGGKIEIKVASTLRAAAFLSGTKVLVGHAFWIKVIQYYGDGSNSLDHYAKLYDYCSLASDLNPRFIPIYTYGAAALAFHLHRPEEAARLLQKGIQANPEAPRLKLLYAAIGFQNTERYDLFIPVLEEEAGRPDAPDELVNILANTYKKVGRYGDAIRLWKKILADGDTNEKRIIAAQKLQELYALTKTRGGSK